MGSGSDLLITIEELGKQINGTIQQASNLQIKINELLGPTGNIIMAYELSDYHTYLGD